MSEKTTTDELIAKLVARVKDAVESTNDRMLFDIIWDDKDEEVGEMLKEALEWGDVKQAVAEALGTIFGRHEETMKDAAQECARFSLRNALAHAATGKGVEGE